MWEKTQDRNLRYRFQLGTWQEDFKGDTKHTKKRKCQKFRRQKKNVQERFKKGQKSQKKSRQKKKRNKTRSKKDKKKKGSTPTSFMEEDMSLITKKKLW